MSDSSDTSPTQGEENPLWLKSESGTDFRNVRIWTPPAPSGNPFRDASTTRRLWKPAVEISSVNPQGISIRAFVSPLASYSENENPFYVRLLSTPTSGQVNEASWAPQIISRPERLWTFTQALAATAQLGDTASDAALDGIVRFGRGIRFEDGVENDFSRRLVAFVSAYGNRAVASLDKAVMDRSIPSDIASEALTWIARIKDRSTYESRLGVLIKALLSPSADVRDGASLGLALLNDRAAIPWARLAVEMERNLELRTDMAAVLSQLESRP